MDSWRDSASPQAQQDLDGLLDAVLEFATQQLGAHGEFFPYAAAVGIDGNAEMIAARPHSDDEHPASADVLGACHAALASERDHIRAAAVVADVRLDDGSDAVRVELEHSEGHALTVLLPYATDQLRREVEYGQLAAQAGLRRLWA